MTSLDAPNEKEISHGRVSWQTHWTHFAMGAVGFIDWLDDGATLSQPVYENPHFTQWPEHLIVKQIVTLVVICLADVDRMRVAADKRTEPAMLVSDGRAEQDAA